MLLNLDCQRTVLYLIYKCMLCLQLQLFETTVLYGLEMFGAVVVKCLYAV